MKMLQILEKRNIIAILAASALLTGCGGNRSTMYDVNGIKVNGSKKTEWIFETDDGKEMVANNFVYVPGGFDVDDDGIDEGGFWLAKFEAREGNETIPTVDLGNVDDLIRNHFMVYNTQSQRFDSQLAPGSTVYQAKPISDILGFHASRVTFSSEGNATGSYSAIEAIVSLESSQVKGAKWHISLPSEKQWMQVEKLIINNGENWSGGKVGEGKLFQGLRYGTSDRRYFVISNGILGLDNNVPEDYSVRVYDLSGSLAEWTRGMIAIDDRFLGGDKGTQEFTQLGADTPRWWLPILEGKSFALSSLDGVGMYFDGSNIGGASDTLDITGSTGFVDNYAVVARGGSNARGDKKLTGIGAVKLEYGPGFKDPSIGFRGASEYIE